jgi:hypothetical protein
MKKVRFSFIANPNDIHKRSKVLPKPASPVSMTNVKVLSHVGIPSIGDRSTTKPFGFAWGIFDTGSNPCVSASCTSI